MLTASIHLPLTLPDKWSPALQIRTVLLSIQALLSSPNCDDPLRGSERRLLTVLTAAADVAEHWKRDEAGAQRQAAEWTQKYASA